MKFVLCTGRPINSIYKMSEFWAGKVRTYFSKVLDADSDGLFSKKDAENMVDKLADLDKLSPEQTAKTKRLFVEVNRF